MVMLGMTIHGFNRTAALEQTLEGFAQLASACDNHFDISRMMSLPSKALVYERLLGAS
jgi:hypothetical protein